jgi:hypothetical protein
LARHSRWHCLAVTVTGTLSQCSGCCQAAVPQCAVLTAHSAAAAALQLHAAAVPHHWRPRVTRSLLRIPCHDGGQMGPGGPFKCRIIILQSWHTQCIGLTVPLTPGPYHGRVATTSHCVSVVISMPGRLTCSQRTSVISSHARLRALMFCITPTPVPTRSACRYSGK